MRRITVLIFVQAIVVGSPAEVTADEQRPNVLMIAVDDLNDWVGCMGGHPNAKTPHIDQLAERGTLFVNAHCQAPICGPSRASLLTGLLPTTSGIYGQISDSAIRKASPASAEAVLLPDYFEQHGYRSWACGKIFHGGDKARVFDEYGGQSSFGPKPAERFRYDPAWFPDKIGGTQTDWGAYPERDDQMPDFRIAEYGIGTLRQHHDQPFFLALGFMRPHVPWYVPQEWFDQHPLEGIRLPPYQPDDFADIPEMSRRVNELTAMPTTDWALKTGEWPRIVQGYLACTTFVDAQIGRVLEALNSSPYRKNTIVILWSDHGYHLGEKNRFAKQALWDRANRVPLIIALPEQGKNAICRRSVGLIDVYPTLADLCGLPANPRNEGHSLRPLLKQSDADWPHAVLTSYGPENHAIQAEHYRYYLYEDGSEELYDHIDDPNEWKNLAASDRKACRELRKLIPVSPATSSPLNKYPTNAYFLDRYSD